MDHAPEAVRQRRQLTWRQAQVVQLAASGMSDKEIARHLGLSKRTVEDHFTAARHRWEAATRAELTAMAAMYEAAARLPGPAGEGRVDNLGNGTRASAPSDGSCSENQKFRNITITTGRSRTGGPPPLKVLATDDMRGGRRRGRPTVMTPERIAAARELLRYHTIAQVAQKLGVGRTTLYTHLSAITRSA
jgi:DNA-binding CsgD family transcriptional regulator